MLAKRRPGEDRGRLVRRERLIWIAADSALADLYTPPSISRAIALEALERAGRSWRMVCKSGSLSGLNAAALAGLGICDGFVPPGLSELPRSAGLPGSAISNMSSLDTAALCAGRRTRWPRPFLTMPIGCKAAFGG